MSKEHAPDPLILLHGGPGAAATDLAPAYSNHPIRRRRDIVMIDQRGTGGSHALECDLFGQPPDLQRLATSLFHAEQVRACRERLEKIADPAQYTTAAAMDDVEEARQWLGYTKVNLWGGSYGSLAAQVYLRRHESSVRAVVLQGVLPPDAFVASAATGQRAIDLLIERQRADYPHLREDFAAMFERLRRGADVTIHDREGRQALVRPSVEVVAEGIRHRLYTDTSPALAKMVHSAASGDLAPVVQAAVNAEMGLDNRLAMGLLLSVTCTESMPLATAERTARETAGTFLGDLRIRDQEAACAQWVRGELPPDAGAAVRSNVPVLLMSGYRDPATPPSFGDRVASQLPNSRHVVFPEASHGWLGDCGRDLMTDFIERGTVKGLDTSCVAALPLARGPAIAGGLAVGLVVLVLVWRRRHDRPQTTRSLLG